MRTDNVRYITISALICQRITNAIKHIFGNIGHVVVHFLDDFAGVNLWEVAWMEFKLLSRLLKDIGADKAVEKAVEPAMVVEFLGIIFDTIELCIKLSKEKVQELHKELNKWWLKQEASLKEVQSQVGKSNFAAKVMSNGCIFVMYLLYIKSITIVTTHDVVYTSHNAK